MDTRTVDNCPDKVRVRAKAIELLKRGAHKLTPSFTPAPPKPPPSLHPRQASATTNYVYVAPSDPLAAAQFVEIGPL